MQNDHNRPCHSAVYQEYLCAVQCQVQCNVQCSASGTPDAYVQQHIIRHLSTMWPTAWMTTTGQQGQTIIAVLLNKNFVKVGDKVSDSVPPTQAAPTYCD